MPNEIRATVVITRFVNPDAIGEQLKPKMHSLGQAIARRGQRLVPKRTWQLHDTFGVETEQRGDAVTTRVSVGGALAPYWREVEYGTSKMAAQPYLTPALLQSRSADLNFTGGDPKRHGVAAIARANRRAARG